MYNFKIFLIVLAPMVISFIFGAQATAQPTAIAVMEARVNIISGVGISAINPVSIQSSEDVNDLVDLGSFVVSTLPGIDISAHLKNTFPEDLKESLFSRLSAKQTMSETGFWRISLTGLLVNEEVRSRHKENISLVVDYL